MAEFVEVMKQRQRMCDLYMSTVNPCLECVLHPSRNGTSLGCTTFTIEHPEEAEKIIMDWAKEHPIKTNYEKFNEALIELFGENAPNFNIGYCTGFECSVDGKCNECKWDNFWNRAYKDPK